MYAAALLAVKESFMQWGNVQALYALGILPLVAVLLVWARRRREEAAARFAEPAMQRRLLPAAAQARLRWKGGLLLLALALMIVAAARPRFGLYFESVSQRGADLLVVLDVSRSMAADDVAPNRLERAKSDIRDLLPHLREDRVGLLLFAGAPVLKVPLTQDQELYRLELDAVDFSSAPAGGTRIGEALRRALQALPVRTDRDQILVLISDGEDQESRPREAAQEAARRGVKIVTIGLGDARLGARIPVGSEQGQVHYLEEAGHEHWSRLQEGLLKELALSTHGAYVPAGTSSYDLGQVYEDYLAGLTRGELSSGPRPRYGEQYQLFLALALLLLVVEAALSGFPPRGAEPAREAAS